MKTKLFARRFIIVLITLALATFLFTIYATSINPIVRNVMSDIGIDENVIDDVVNSEIKAEAAYSIDVGSKITNTTRSYTITGVACDSYRTQLYDTDGFNSLAGTDKIGIESNAWHSGEDYMVMWIIYDLGSWAGTAVQNGRAKVTVSGTAVRHKDMDSAKASITATSSGYSSASSAYSGTDVGTSNTSVSTTFTNTNARYIRIAVCGKDKHTLTGSMGKVEMSSIKVVFEATKNTAPSFPNTGHSINPSVSATDNNGGGISTFTVGGTSRSNPYTLPDFGTYSLSATDWMKKSASATVYYYAPAVNLKADNGQAYVTSGSSVSGFTTSSLARNNIGYNSKFTVRALPGEGYYLSSLIFKSGTTTLETISVANLSYNSSYGWYHTFTVPDPTSKGYNDLSVEAVYAQIPSAGAQEFLYDGISKPYSPAAIGDGNSFVTKVTSYTSTGTSAPVVAGTYTVSLQTYTKSGTYPLGSTTATLTIHKIPVALSITAASTTKIYDGSTNATSYVGSRIISPILGVVAGTSLEITDVNKNIYQTAIDNDLSFTGGTATFDSPNAGERIITLTAYSLVGERLDTCYIYETPNLTTSKVINKASLTISIECTDFIADGIPGKYYDATSLIGVKVNLAGVIEADKNGGVIVSDGYTATFDTIYAGTGKTITSNNINLSGPSVSNYEVTNSKSSIGYIAGNIFGEIRPKILKIQFATEDKIYDGTSSANVVSLTFQDGFAPCTADESRVNIKYSNATFATSNAGNGIVVTLNGLGIETLNDTTKVLYNSYSLDLSATPIVTANIAKKTLRVSEVTCADKTYDNTNIVSKEQLTFKYVGIVNNDDVSVDLDNTTFVYASTQAGAGIRVYTTSYVMKGGALANYEFYDDESDKETTSNIIPKQISLANVTVDTISDVVYDETSQCLTTNVKDIALDYTFVEGKDMEFDWIGETGSTTSAGKITVTITGKGNYQGAITTSYNIVKADVILEIENLSITYGQIVTVDQIAGLCKVYRANDSEKTQLSITSYSMVDGAGFPSKFTVDTSSRNYKFQVVLASDVLVNHNAPTAANFKVSVARKSLKITAQSVSQVYGETATTTFSYSYEGLESGDEVNGRLACPTYQNLVGEYAIEKGTITNDTNPNYDVSYVGATYTVTRRAIEIIPTASLTKTYGSVDPAFTYTVKDKLTSYTLEVKNVGGENKWMLINTKGTIATGYESFYFEGIVGTLSRSTGENVGYYIINRGDFEENSDLVNVNYTVSFYNQAVEFSIAKKAVTVVIDDKTSIYGDELEELTFTVTGLVQNTTINGITINDTTLNGIPVRASANNQPTSIATVGTYNIIDNPTTANKISTANNPNYLVVSVTPGVYTITKRPITITPTQASYTSEYGTPQPVFTGTYSYTGDDTKPAIVNNDIINGSLSRTNTSVSNVGTYYVTLGTISNSNYDIVLSSNTIPYTITRRTVTVSITAYKIDYGKTPDATFITYRLIGIVSGETLVGTLELPEFNDEDYDVYYQYKVYKEGDVIPDGFVVGDTILDVNGDPIIDTDAFGNPIIANRYIKLGSYSIRQGTLSNSVPLRYKQGDVIPEGYAVGDIVRYQEGDVIPEGSNIGDIVYYDPNPNYTIVFPTGEENFIVEPLVANITPVINQSAVFGEEGFKITFKAYSNAGIDITNNHMFTDTLEGALALDMQGADRLVPNTYEIVQGTLYNPNYLIQFNYTKAEDSNAIVPTNPVYFEITKKKVTVTPIATSQYFGEADAEIGYTHTELVGDDVLTGSLIRANLGRVTVGYYDVEVGTLGHKIGGQDTGWYEIILNDASLKYQILKRPIVITPIAATQVFGASKATTIECDYANAVAGSELPAGSTAFVYGYETLPAGVFTRYNPSNISTVGKYPITINEAYANTSPYYSISLSYRAEEEFDADTNPIVYYEITKKAVSIMAYPGDNSYLVPSYTYDSDIAPINWTHNNGAVKGYDIVFTPICDVTRTSPVGEYPIYHDVEATIANNPNYEITFDYKPYKIVARTIVITPNNDQTKVYDGLTATDPVFTYTVTTTTGSAYNGFSLLDGDTLLSRETHRIGYVESVELINNPDGQNAGMYFITLLADNANYPNFVFEFTSGVVFEIEKAVNNVTFTDGTVLEDGQFVRKLTYNGLVQEPSATLDYGTANFITNGYKKDVGTYTITLNAAQSENYLAVTETITVYVEAKRLDDVTQDAIVDDMSALTKIYSDNDMDFVKTIIGCEGEVITLVMGRENGENVGKYDFNSIVITNANGEIDYNYTVDFATGANVDVFEITVREIVITPELIKKEYRDEDDLVIADYLTGYGDNDIITITYTRELGEEVGLYNLTSLATDNANYALSFAVGSNVEKFQITRRTAYVTAIATGHVYGATSDSALEYNVTNLYGTDILVGTLKREIGNDAGTYIISQDTLTDDNNPNYHIEYTQAIYTIAQIALTIRPYAHELEYGDTEEALTYEIIEGALVSGETLDGALAREMTTAVGVYDIEQGTLNNEVVDGVMRNKNYNITFVEGVKYVITTRALTLAVQYTTQVYGEAKSLIEYDIIGELAYEETALNGAFDVVGYDVGIYDINDGTIKSNNPNYNITVVSYAALYEITKRPLRVVADALTQIYGDSAVQLTYVIPEGTFVNNIANCLVGEDVLNGELIRESGSFVASYNITIGTLNNTNYAIDFVGNTYTITKRPLTIRINNQENEFGAEIIVDQTAYEIISGNVISNDDLGINISKPDGASMGYYPLDVTYTNENYAITFTQGYYVILKYRAYISTEASELFFLFDGNEHKISALCSSGADVIYFVDGEEVVNAFVEPGVYEVILRASATENHLAPADVKVILTILQDRLTATTNGIDAVVINKDGYAPDVVLELIKIEKDDPTLNENLSSNQKVVRGFTVEIKDDNNELINGTGTISIKVPSALVEQDTVSLLISRNGVYEVIEVEIEEDGYVTLEVDNLSTIAFVETTDGSSIIIGVLIGAALLIILGGMAIFMFRKRY